MPFKWYKSNATQRHSDTRIVEPSKQFILFAIRSDKILNNFLLFKINDVFSLDMANRDYYGDNVPTHLESMKEPQNPNLTGNLAGQSSPVLTNSSFIVYEIC